jgi:ribose 5-phosphate isomerase A
MELKKEAARVAYSLVENNRSIGLGDGNAVRFLASYIIKGIRSGLHLKLYSSSLKTEQFLRESGMMVCDIAETDSLDLYFDGCDQVDIQLNVLKSGAGIHTREKLLAAMANHFVILADESKYISEFDPQFPLVLEVLPEAIPFVTKEFKNIFPEASLSMRKSVDNGNVLVGTRNGNYLVDCRFPQWPAPECIQKQTRQIVGVVEISLFYQMVNEAVIAGENGIYKYQRKNDVVDMIGKHPLELP